MNKIRGFSFLVVALLVVLVSGCAPATVAPTNTPPPPTSTVLPLTFTPSPLPPTPTVTPQSSNTTKLNLDWLLTADEINSISEGIGVIQWELGDVKSDEYRVCHFFQGQSDSFNPNQALNCVYLISAGSSFDDIVSRMHKAELLFPDEIPLPTSLKFEDDFSVFGGTFPNGHLVYDLLLYKGDLLYWVSVTLGRYSNDTIENIYKKYNQKEIDTFLNDSITINLEKSK
jgi:hypothetical protein